MRIIDPNTGRSHVEKRRKRFDEPGVPRELTFSCHRQYAFLSRERTREWFREAVESARLGLRFQLWAYLIMPEHIHMLVVPAVPGDVSRLLQIVKEHVARMAVAYLKAHAPDWLSRITVREGKRIRHRFWQPGGGYDRNVTGAAALRFMIDYIHANPVHRGLVARAEDWEWSSARWFLGLLPVKIEMNSRVLVELARG